MGRGVGERQLERERERAADDADEEQRPKPHLQFVAAHQRRLSRGEGAARAAKRRGEGCPRLGGVWSSVGEGTWWVGGGVCPACVLWSVGVAVWRPLCRAP